MPAVTEVQLMWEQNSKQFPLGYVDVRSGYMKVKETHFKYLDVFVNPQICHNIKQTTTVFLWNQSSGISLHML